MLLCQELDKMWWKLQYINWWRVSRASKRIFATIKSTIDAV